MHMPLLIRAVICVSAHYQSSDNPSGTTIAMTTTMAMTTAIAILPAFLTEEDCGTFPHSPPRTASERLAGGL